MSGIKANTSKDENLRRQGSFRKLLALNTNGESQLSMSVKMIERPTASQTTKEYAVYLQEYNVLSEYSMLCTQDLKGVYIIPSAQSSFRKYLQESELSKISIHSVYFVCADSSVKISHSNMSNHKISQVLLLLITSCVWFCKIWFGVQFVRQGVLQGGVFRFTITLPQEFPDGTCPKVTFQSRVFHPLVDPQTGELCTSWGFPEWRKTNRVWQLVQYVTKVLNKVDPKMTPVNQEASVLLESNYDSFKEQTRKCVNESLEQIYDPPTTDDPHYITFNTDFNDLPDSIKEDLFKPKEEEGSKPLGLSWVQPGSLEPFSKPEAR